MVSFVLTTFAQDEEIQTIHMPLIFTAILDLLLVSYSPPYTRCHHLKALSSGLKPNQVHCFSEHSHS